MDSKLIKKTKQAAAARAEVSISSAYRMDKGKLTGDKKNREWKTRKDPFTNVWDDLIVPKLEAHPSLLAITILENLQSKYPEEYPDKLLRTLQRRLKKWKAIHGPAKDIIFRQEHHPGKMGISDFTTLKNVQITISGKVFEHILYHFRLSYSGWSFLKIVEGGESCSALLEGLQEALWRIGGSPSEHRTDSLSAAYKNIKKEAAEDLTKKYNEFCSHYKMLPTRNNKGISHENGSIESPHGHIKRRIAQALIIRGNNNFDTIELYQSWLDTVVVSHNRRNAREFEFERGHLQKLPMYKTTDFSEAVIRVNSTSTIVIKKITYSVPSRLCGEVLRAHIHTDRIKLYLGSDKVFEVKRAYVDKKTTKNKVIDYKHIIHALNKKPQAFRYSLIRDDLLPNEKYRSIWDYVDKEMQPRLACKYIVKVLNIAHKYNCEDDLGNHIIMEMNKNKIITIAELEQRYKKESGVFPDIKVYQHNLSDYDKMLEV